MKSEDYYNLGDLTTADKAEMGKTKTFIGNFKLIRSDDFLRRYYLPAIQGGNFIPIDNFQPVVAFNGPALYVGYNRFVDTLTGDVFDSRPVI